MTQRVEDPDVESIELELLLEGLQRRYGAEFSGYARSSLRRRVRHFLGEQHLDSISAAQARALRDPDFARKLLDQFSVSVTSMFRDPSFFRTFREKVVPHLHAAPLVRVWCAGIATGEEVYSMAILLMEEDLYERSRIYATDMNGRLVETAKRGVFETRWMGEFEENYARAGGKSALTDYFQYGYERAIFKKALRKNIVFAQHNLAVDTSFNEFNVILCRNVMIYFGRDLQNRVHSLLHQSLRRGGFICLGRRETLDQSPFVAAYEVVDADERIYRRRR